MSDVGDNAAPVKAPKCVVRKYDPYCTTFGFIVADSDAELKAQCLKCGHSAGYFVSYMFFFLMYLGRLQDCNFW